MSSSGATASHISPDKYSMARTLLRYARTSNANSTKHPPQDTQCFRNTKKKNIYIYKRGNKLKENFINLLRATLIKQHSTILKKLIFLAQIIF